MLFRARLVPKILLVGASMQDFISLQFSHIDTRIYSTVRAFIFDVDDIHDLKVV